MTILGRTAFNPSRIGVRGLPKLAETNAKVAADFLGDWVIPAIRGTASDLRPGDARVLRDGLGKTNVFRAKDGTLHAVSLRCTHLGCLLRFNGAERSWDCPCHGSRFDIDGAVLEGPPATRCSASRSDLLSRLTARTQSGFSPARCGVSLTLAIAKPMINTP